MDTKRCARCREEKSLDAFRWPHNSYCRTCEREYVAARRASPAGRASRLKEREAARIAQRLRRERVLTHYGHACACCGVTHSAWLTIDHLNGNGAQHRKDQPNARQITQWLEQHNYPDGFRILCWNCHVVYGHDGQCPHQTNTPRSINRPVWKVGRPQEITTDP